MGLATDTVTVTDWHWQRSVPSQSLQSASAVHVQFLCTISTATAHTFRGWSRLLVYFIHWLNLPAVFFLVWRLKAVWFTGCHVCRHNNMRCRTVRWWLMFTWSGLSQGQGQGQGRDFCFRVADFWRNIWTCVESRPPNLRSINLGLGSV